MTYAFQERRSQTPLAGARFVERLRSREYLAGPQVVRYVLQGAEEALRQVGYFQANWDGAGSPAPSKRAIFNASTYLPDLYLAARTTVHRWRSPHVSASERGEISFEWWEGTRKLTMYFGDANVEVIKVWGPHIDNDMEEVDLVEAADFGPLWSWLHGD
jgi:hypothetical protein